MVSTDNRVVYLGDAIRESADLGTDIKDNIGAVLASINR